MSDDLELQLTSALDDGDVDGLACHLHMAVASGRAPSQELLSWMLIEAIRHSDAASALLLLDEFSDKGEPFFRSNGVFIYPLVEAIAIMESRTPFHGGRCGSQFEKAEQIVRHLLSKGITLLRRNADDSHDSLLGSLFTLAANMPKSASSLLAALPASALRCNFDTGLDGDYSLSPFRSVFLQFAIHNHNEIQMHFVRRIFSVVVIPMLKSGANLMPDIFSPSQYPLLEEMVRLDTIYSTAIWLRENVISAIIVEARWTSYLPAIDWHEAFLKDDQLGQKSSKKFENFLSNQFPRSLQSAARCAILRELPLKADIRNAAIAKLTLPRRLSEFLKFDEFNIPEYQLFT